MSFLAVRRSSSDVTARASARAPEPARGRRSESSRLPAAAGQPWILQRKCEECEDEEDDGKRLRRSAEQGGAEPARAPPAVHSALRGGGRPLDPALRRYFEPRLGHDLRAVRVHTGAEADASARAVRAKAYAVGTDVVFRQGAFSPETKSGKRLLAHELAHVAQGSEGARAEQGPLSVSSPEDGAEREADRMADAVMRGETVEAANAPAETATLQRQQDDSQSCDGWESDCQSMAIKIAEHFVYDHLHWPASASRAVACDSSGRGAAVTFDRGTVRVSWGRGTATARQFSSEGFLFADCTYTYTCTQGGAVILDAGDCLG